MAQWIKTDGSIEEIKDHEFSLEELQSFVGGLIDILYITRDKLMIVNDEGLLDELPQNHIATTMANELIVGNVLVCNSQYVK